MINCEVTSSSSQYIGVSYSVERSRWVATRFSKHQQKTVYNGGYCDEETAAHASDTLARKLIANGEKGHKLNFPDDDTEVHAEKVVISVPDDAEVNITFKSSKFVGVSFNKANSNWRVSRCSKHEKKAFYNGSFDDEKTAAHASDTLARKLMKDGEQGHYLNFPDDDTEVHADERQTKRKRDHDSNVLNVPVAKSSKFVGVSYNKPSSMWLASRCSKKAKKTVHNGHYKDEQTAALASDNLARELLSNGEKDHKLNFPDNDTEKCPKNHALKRFKTTTTDHGCDSCGMSVDFPKGATMFGCRKCDFDLCEKCHKE